MNRPPFAAPKASAAAGLRNGDDIWVTDVVLLGVSVDAHVAIDFAEHQRRETVGVGAVTNPVLLDRLLDLPVAVPVMDPPIWAEMAGQLPGIVERDKQSPNVTRILRSPLAVEDVIVSAVAGRELRAVQDASWFASFTRRWIAASRNSLAEAVRLEAKLCGVGILDAEHRALLPAEPPVSATVDKWSWLLQEKVYRQWLSQLLPKHARGSQLPTTGAASSPRGHLFRPRQATH